MKPLFTLVLLILLTGCDKVIQVTKVPDRIYRAEISCTGGPGKQTAVIQEWEITTVYESGKVNRDRFQKVLKVEGNC